MPATSSSRVLPAVCVVGAGYWGKNLVRSFHVLGALRSVCDTSEDLLAGVRDTYPDVRTCLALSEVLADDGVDAIAIAIATPAETHHAIAREALLAGKHVFVEKPFVLDEAHGAELIELAESRGLTLMVGHLLQYHPVFRHLRAMVEAGELGRIQYIYSNRLNLGKIRREENAMWSFAPHDISMILSLAGEEPERVMYTGGNYLHGAIADVTTTQLAFASGTRAHIFVSWLHPFKEQKLVVVGEKMMAEFNDTRPWADKLRLYPHRIDWDHGQPVPIKADYENPDVPEGEPLKGECAHFLHCAATGATPITDGREGLSVLRVLNASQASLEAEGCAVKLGMTEASGAKESSASVHPTAVIDDDVQLGEGTTVWHFSHVLSGTRIGANCSLGQNVVAGPDVTIGNGCKIQNNVSVYKGVTLEDEVFCGPSMVFTNVHAPRAHIPRMHEARTTTVGRRATLGANCTIVCGHDVGHHAFVAAGAVVTHTVAPHALVMGNPARRVGWVCECGVRLSASGEELVCEACGLHYAEAGSGTSMTKTT